MVDLSFLYEVDVYHLSIHTDWQGFINIFVLTITHPRRQPYPAFLSLLFFLFYVSLKILNLVYYYILSL